jgi:AcrR family transcriptional regulator
MPYPKEHKAKTRDRILASAARLFTSKGFDNTSIDEVMADAGLTRGGFYAHFSDKGDLYSEAIVYAASNSPMATGMPAGKKDGTWLDKVLTGYLSTEHVNAENSCPLAFLVTDVAVRNPKIRKTYTKTYRMMNKVIADHTKGLSTRKEETIMALTAMMIGGVAVGRALDDPDTTDKLMNSCRVIAKELLKLSAP